jgi:hypothetical protein
VVVFGGEDPPPELPDLARVLRHPDMSVVIDLSHAAQSEKINYMKSLLPMLAAIRMNTGLPHRIVIDEAHYFLHEPNVMELLDLDLGAYTLVTYRLADLHPDLRDAIECVLVKRTTAPHELETLAGMLKSKGACTSIMPHLSSLAMEEAALLPGMRETGGQCVKFKLFPRLTPHVRHKAKYLDVQLLEDQGFWFTQDGKPVAGPARTLKSFLALLQVAPNSVLIGHAQRGDFSRWIANVFHDHALASEIRKVEHQLRLGYVHDFTNAVVNLIQERYEFSPGRGGEMKIAVFSDEVKTNQALTAKTGSG